MSDDDGFLGQHENKVTITEWGRDTDNSGR